MLDIIIGFVIGLTTGIISGFIVSGHYKRKDRLKNLNLKVKRVDKQYDMEEDVSILGFHLSNYTGYDNLYVKVLLYSPHIPNLYEMYGGIVYKQLFTNGWTIPVNNEEIYKIHFFEYIAVAEDEIKYEHSIYSDFIRNIQDNIIKYKLYILPEHKRKKIDVYDIKNYKLVKDSYLQVY